MGLLSTFNPYLSANQITVLSLSTFTTKSQDQTLGIFLETIS